MNTIMTNPKCILPWIHLQIDNDGTTRACCNARQVGQPLGNVLKEEIVTMWNNDNYQRLRRQMLSGIEPDECKPCYDSERLGLYSKRLRENEDWAQYSHLANADTAEFKIRHLDVRFNNVCNFKCRYCDPARSHSWANDYKQMGIPINTISAINVNGEELYNIIKTNIVDDLESVFFCGGEPLLMDQHLELLKELDARKKYNTKLLYVTNLSKLQFKGTDYIELWSKFTNVNVHISLDTVGPQLEYIRCGAVWKDIEQNLKIVFSHKELLKPKIAITVSIFNASSIINTVEYLVGTGYINYDDISIHVVKHPYIYSSQILPLDIKRQITTEVENFLLKNKLPYFFKSRYEYFLNYMNDKDTYENHKVEFIQMTKTLDNIRNEDFNIVFPELKNYYD